MSQMISNLIELRYEIQDGGAARRHRYKIYDRLTKRVLAKFDELLFAENSLKTYRDAYQRELENEAASHNLLPIPA